LVGATSTGDAGVAGVDDVADAGDGKARFRRRWWAINESGGGRGGEDFICSSAEEAGIEGAGISAKARRCLRAVRRPPRGWSRSPDWKMRMSPGPFGGEFIQRRREGVGDFESSGRGSVGGEGVVAGFSNGVRSRPETEDGAVVEMAAGSARVDGAE